MSARSAVTDREILAACLPETVTGRIGDDHGNADTLPPDERALIANAGTLRRRQFAAGRELARAALSAMGHPVVALGRRADGSADWPTGVRGSISHTAGLALAVTGPATRLCSIGIDVEALADFPAAAETTVFTAAERARAMSEPQKLATFSAKETIYKCLAPLGAHDLDFLDVEVHWVDKHFIVHPVTARAVSIHELRRLRGQHFMLGGGTFMATVGFVEALPPAR